MSPTKYSYGKDYGSIFGYNNNWWLQFKAVKLVLSQNEDVKHHMADIMAQFIHNYIELDISADARQDTEWYLAVNVISLEFGHDGMNLLNWIIKCVLAKACFLMIQTGADFPSPGSALVSIDGDKYEVKKSFIHYLHELGKMQVDIIRLLIFATSDRNPVKIGLQDVEACLGEELREIFERRKNGITISSLNQT